MDILNNIKAEVLSNYMTEYFNYMYSKNKQKKYGCKLITFNTLLKRDLKVLINNSLDFKQDFRECLFKTCKKCELNSSFLPIDIYFLFSNFYNAIYIYNKQSLLSIVDYNDEGRITSFEVFDKDKNFPVEFDKNASFEKISSCIQEHQFQFWKFHQLVGFFY